MATERITNFKKLQVSGSTKEEAWSKAPFTIVGDATQAFKNWASKQTGAITDALKKEFYADYLTKHKETAGRGYSITEISAVKDTRERPFEMVDIKNEKGKRKYVTTYQIFDASTGQLLAETTETKAKAKEIAKRLYIEKGLKSDVVCLYTKTIEEGEPVAFRMKYTPSKNCKAGVYTVFGIEND